VAGEGPDKMKGSTGNLSALVEQVHEAVEASRGDAIALVDILRLLERLHREVTEGAFQEALPQNRQELFKLLRVVEEKGGWPHIPRYKLQTLCSQIAPEEDKAIDPI